MSVVDIKNKKIIIKNEKCNNFVIFRQEIKDYTKLFKHKQIVNIDYNIKITFR